MSKLVQNFLVIILIFIIISGLFALFSPETEQIPEVPFSQLAFEVAQEKVKEIKVQGEDVYITYKAGTNSVSFKEPGSSIVESFSIYGVTQEQLKKIIIKIEKQKSGTLDWLVPLLSILFPLLIFGWFFWIIFRQAKQ